VIKSSKKYKINLIMVVFSKSQFNNNLNLTMISLPPKNIVKSRSDCN